MINKFKKKNCNFLIRTKTITMSILKNLKFYKFYDFLIVLHFFNFLLDFKAAALALSSFKLDVLTMDL